MNRSIRSLLLVAAAACVPAALAACGIITAPASLPAAVAENAFFRFTGTVVDAQGQPLDGVIVTFHKTHHFWTPLKGSADVYTDRVLRVDHDFDFDERGSELDLTFAKDGYLDAVIHLDADHPDELTSNDGAWPNIKGFPVVLQSTKSENADLTHFHDAISYARYPFADCISLPNLATEGRSGDIRFMGKDARDATIFPPGTLYLTLEREAPKPINAKGDIDPRDLDIPHHITLHLPGTGNGFLHIDTRTGYNPMTTTDAAPAAGYARELTIARDRLKAMRTANPSNLLESHEYFFFRANNHYGKGSIAWSSLSGAPEFRFDLYEQPLADNRDLTLHKL